MPHLPCTQPHAPPWLPAAALFPLQEGARGSPLLTAAGKLAETEVRRILRRVTAPANKKEAKVRPAAALPPARLRLLRQQQGGLPADCAHRPSSLPLQHHFMWRASSRGPSDPSPPLLPPHHQATMKPLGRMLAKIMHAAPMAVAEQLIRQASATAGVGRAR